MMDTYDEIEQMLRKMPRDWRAQYNDGRAAYATATGIYLPQNPTPEEAMQLIGITAGGRSSGDSPTGRYPVPDRVRAEALHGLRLSHENNYGAWMFIGVARAIQLTLSPGVPLETRERMSNYFKRHAKDKKSVGFYDDENPSRGYMAWLNWGGDAGQKWVTPA